MSEPLSNPVLPATIAAAITPSPEPAVSSTPAAPATAAPVAITEPPKPTGPPIEIDKVRSIEDAIAVKLGEKVVKAAVPAVPAVTATQAPVVEPTAATPETDPALEAEITTTAGKMGKAERDAFAKKTYENRDLKRKLAEAEAKSARVAELEKQLADAPKTTVDPTVTERLAEYEKLLAAHNLESTETYKREIGAPAAAAHEAALAVVKQHSLDETVFNALWASPPSAEREAKLGELMANMSPISQNRFVQALMAKEALDVRAAAMRADAKSSLDAVAASEKAKSEAELAQRKAEAAAAAPVTWASIVADAKLAPVEGNTAWNEALTVAEKFADRDFAAFDTKSQVTIMQRAGAYPLIVGTVQHLTSENARLTAELAKLTASSPAAGAGVRQTVTTEPGKRESLSEAVERRLAAQGVA